MILQKYHTGFNFCLIKMNVVEQSYDERNQARTGGISLLRKIIDVHMETLTEALQATGMIIDVCRIIFQYIGVDIFFSDKFRLVVWHQYFSEEHTHTTSTVGGGFEILQIPSDSWIRFNLKNNYLFVSAGDREKLFPFSIFPYAHGSVICGCGDTSHDLELQFLHHGKWHHLWDDYNEYSYPAINEDEIEWTTDRIGCFGFYKVMKDTKENLFVSSIHLPVESLLKTEKHRREEKSSVSLLD